MERTEAACCAALHAQCDAEVRVIHERPFSAALRTSLQIGIEADREFTLCVDADVLMAAGAVRRMLRPLQSASDAFFAVGYSWDKFYGQPKSRSAHLYRTRYLKEAIEAIPTDVNVPRPETAMKSVLLARGQTLVSVEDRPLGLHGYGQFYADIFRTIVARGRKSPNESAQLLGYFSSKERHDLDLRVALWGLKASETIAASDAEGIAARCTTLLSEAGITEKTPATPGESRRLALGATFASLVPLDLWRRWRRVGEFAR
jgi:hypothetical protein